MLLLRMTHSGNELFNVIPWERAIVNNHEQYMIHIQQSTTAGQQQGMFHREVENTIINRALVNTKIREIIHTTTFTQHAHKTNHNKGIK